MNNKIWLSIFVLALAGCAATSAEHVDNGWPEPRALAKSYPSFRPPVEEPQQIALPSNETELPALLEPTDTITLKDALSQALLKNPELAASSWEVRAAESPGSLGLPGNSGTIRSNSTSLKTFRSKADLHFSTLNQISISKEIYPYNPN